MLQAGLACAVKFPADVQLMVACMVYLKPHCLSGYAGDSLKLLHVISDPRSPSTAGMDLRQFDA